MTMVPMTYNGYSKRAKPAPPPRQESSLRKIFERSFTGVSACVVTLLEDMQPPANLYKDRFLAMLTFSPGEKSETSSTGRGFNYKKAVRFKMNPEKLLALAHAVGEYAAGRSAHVGAYEVMADSAKSAHTEEGKGEKKSLKLEMGRGKPQVVMLVSAGEKKAQMYFDFPQAQAFVRVCQFMADRALELEFERQRKDFVSRDVHQIDDEDEPAGPGR